MTKTDCDLKMNPRMNFWVKVLGYSLIFFGLGWLSLCEGKVISTPQRAAVSWTLIGVTGIFMIGLTWWGLKHGGSSKHD